MNVYELVSRVGGEIVLGRARYRDETGKFVVLAQSNGAVLELTKEGAALAAALHRAEERRAPPQPLSVAQKPRPKPVAKPVTPQPE